MSSLLMSNVDPSGNYLKFVKAFLNDAPRIYNILWVYGDGSNSKTTLFRALQDAFSNEVCRFGLSSPIIPKGTKLAVTEANSTCRDILIQLATIYPTIGFIVEANQLPPKGLDCEKIHCKNNFDGAGEIDVSKYRQELIDAIRK